MHAEVLFPSLADIGFLIFPVAGGVGLWLISGRSSLGSRLTSLLDGLIVTGSLCSSSPGSITLRSVWEAGGGHPCWPSWCRSRTRSATWSWRPWRSCSRDAHPAGAPVRSPAVDPGSAGDGGGRHPVRGVVTADGTYISGALSDTGWVFAFAAFALAGWASARRPMSLRAAGVVRRWH